TTSPLTSTAPRAMSSSHARREATPASAMTRCSRSRCGGAVEGWCGAERRPDAERFGGRAGPAGRGLPPPPPLRGRAPAEGFGPRRPDLEERFWRGLGIDRLLAGEAPNARHAATVDRTASR